MTQNRGFQGRYPYKSYFPPPDLSQVKNDPKIGVFQLKMTLFTPPLGNPFPRDVAGTPMMRPTLVQGLKVIPKSGFSTALSLFTPKTLIVDPT